MQYTFDRLREQTTEILASTGLVAAQAVTLTEPKPNIPADVAFPTFQAARASDTPNPAQFAQQLGGGSQPKNSGGLAGGQN